MGVIRAEPVRVTDWAAKSVGAAWRAFDLQLVTFAGLLAAIGLVMAYTNSVEAGQSVLSGGTVFQRALMWSGIAIVVNIVVTAFDYRWFKTLAWPIYFVNLGLAFFIQRPNLRRLVGVTASADDRVWKERAKRQRYVSYLMAGLVGTIGFLMSAKPDFW